MTAYEIREQEFYPFQGKVENSKSLELLYSSKDNYGGIAIFARLPVFKSGAIKFYVSYSGLHVSCKGDGEKAEEIWPVPKKEVELKQAVRNLSAYKKKFA